MSTIAITTKQRNRIVGLAVAGLIIVAIAVSAIGGSRSTAVDGEQASGSFELFEGGEATFADYRGGPLIINFWASWCPACVAELPEFQSVHERFGDEVTIVGVANQDDRSAALRLAGDVGLTYQLGDDPQGELFRTLDLIAMPSTVFIDADGEIQEVFGGQLDEEGLADRIAVLAATS